LQAGSTPKPEIFVWKSRADGKVVSLLLEVDLVLAQYILRPAFTPTFDLPENVHDNPGIARGLHFNRTRLNIHHQPASGPNGKSPLNISLPLGLCRYTIAIDAGRRQQTGAKGK
jgi:hypothetical protein